MALFKSSPYSFLESLKWIYFYFFPTVKKYVELKQLPMKHGVMDNTGIKISFLGDLMRLDNEVIVTPHCEMLKVLKDSDLVVINLEAPLIREKIEKKTNVLVFSFSEEFILNFLKIYQIPKEKVVFSIANNHMGDHGIEGFNETIKRLDKMGIKYVGDKSNNFLAINIKGLRIGFFGFSNWINCDVFSDEIGIWRKPDLEENKDVDTLIMLPHWSYEFRHFPKKDVVTLAKKMIESGVDIIAGHHPHVLGPIEKIANGICHYSLGNFFAKTIHWATRITGIWNVALSSDGKISGHKFTPFFMQQNKKDFQMKKVNELKPSLKEKVEKRLDIIYPKS